MYQESPFETYDPEATNIHPHKCPNASALRQSQNEITNLRRTLALLWAYLIGEDAWDDAWTYVQEHGEYATPASLRKRIQAFLLTMDS